MRLLVFSRNSAMFYWNLIGSPTVFYSSIENSRARVALKEVIRLLALVFYER